MKGTGSNGVREKTNARTTLTKATSTSARQLLRFRFNLSNDNTCPAHYNQNPLLGPLADNGGPTLTHMPQAGSPAIDHGSGCPVTDQRGATRPVDPTCDIGAVEAEVLVLK